MFTAGERDRVREQLLARAEADSAVTGAAFTGSHATGDGDRWSDIDLVLAVRGELTPVLNGWTRWLYRDLSARHHWGLPAGRSAIRVFLLPGWLEVDLTFAPQADFGPRGPQWHTIFGQPQPGEPFPAPDRGTLTGLAWHHALHARISIERWPPPSTSSPPSSNEPMRRSRPACGPCSPNSQVSASAGRA